jgi:hypothetical protein
VYGLQRIILIDSFMPGLHTSIDLDDHASINGTNGAGKTSIQKLLPFFYGAEPAQLESKVANKDSFLQWYLPRTTSLLIFEYAREGGLCCSVAYRHISGTKPAYRFLKAGFTADRFSVENSNGQRKYCQGSELVTHWKTLGLEYSSQIEIVTNYRGVIQNDRVLLNRSSASTQLRVQGRTYGLGGPNTHMRHIEKVCNSILGHAGKMEKIKDMLADIMIEDNLVLPPPPSHKDNYLLTEQITWMREFDEKLLFFREVLGDYLNLQTINKQLNVYASSLINAESSLQIKLNDNDKLKATQETALEVLKQGWLNQEDSLNAEKSVIRSTIKNAENTIDRIENESRQYESDDLERKKSEYEQLQRLNDERINAIDKIDRLTDNVKEEKTQYQERIIKEEKRHQRTMSDVQVQRQQKEENKNLIKEQLSEKNILIEKNKNAAIENYRSTRAPKREQLVREHATAINQQNAGGRLEEERLQIVNAKDELTKQKKALQQNEETLRKAKETYLNTLKQRDQDQKVLHDMAKDLEENKESRDQLQKYIFPPEGTWLAQLGKDEPGWIHTLGKVVDQKLLLRKDLKPILNTGVAENIYGWELDLGTIALQEFTREPEDLRSEFEAIEERIKRLDEKYQSMEQMALKSEKGRQTTENEKEEQQRRAKRKQQDVALAQNQLDELERQFDEAETQRRKQAKIIAQVLTKQIDEFDSAQKKHIEALNEDYFKEYQQAQSIAAADEGRIYEAIEVLIRDLEEEKAKHKTNEKDLKQEYEIACSNKGVPQELLSRAILEKEEAVNEYERVQSYQKKVLAYTLWLKDQWPLHSQYNQQLTENTYKLRDIKTLFENKKKEYESKRNRSSKDAQAIKQIILKLKEELEKVQNILKRLGIFSDPAAAKEIPLNLLLEKTTRDMDEKAHLSDKLKEDMLQIDSFIMKHGDTQIAIGWERECQELAVKLGQEQSNPYFYLNKPQILDRFINESVPSVKQTLIATLRSVGKEIVDFASGLHEAHLHIKRQASQISKTISENMKIDALSDIRIDMISRVKDQSYWNTLEHFKRDWIQWKDSGWDNLPDERFIQSFGETLENIHDARVNRDLRTLFDLHINMKDNGRPVLIKNDNDLRGASSQGLSFLLLCIIFIGISRLLCKDQQVKLHWPLDELGIIHQDNISLLFTMLNKAGVIMLGGFPSTDPDMLRHFKHRHLVDFQKGISVIDLPEDQLSSLIARRNKAKERVANG